MSGEPQCQGGRPSGALRRTVLTRSPSCFCKMGSDHWLPSCYLPVVAMLAMPLVSGCPVVTVPVWYSGSYPALCGQELK